MQGNIAKLQWIFPKESIIIKYMLLQEQWWILLILGD